MTMSITNFLVVLILGFFVTTTQPMRFNLLSGTTKCISEDIKINAMTVGKYSVINPQEGSSLPNTHKLTVRVSSPHVNNYHYGDQVESGNFAFTAAEGGDYMACFWSPTTEDNKAPETVTIDFDWRIGVAAKDWSNVAKKGHIEGMELELKKLYDAVASIHEEMFYLRGREEEMQQLNRATNSNTATLSFLSILICISVAGLQLCISSHSFRGRNFSSSSYTILWLCINI